MKLRYEKDAILMGDNHRLLSWVCCIWKEGVQFQCTDYPKFQNR